MFGAPPLAINCTVQVQNQTEIQVAGNNTGLGIGGMQPTWSVATTPGVLFTAAWKRWSFDATYVPVVTARQLESSSTRSMDTLQQGGFNLRWRTRRFRAVLSEQAAYGVVTYSTGALATPGMPLTALQPLPTNTTLLTESSRTTLILTGNLTGRAEVSAYGGWLLGGGANAASRAYLPLQDGPIAGASLSYRVARFDWLEARADFTRADFSDAPCTTSPSNPNVNDPNMMATAKCTPRDDTLVLALGLRHRFTGAIDGTIQAGVSGSGTETSEGQPYVFRAYPAAIATLTHKERHLDTRTTYTFTAQLTPIISAQTGAVDQRVQVDGAADWSNSKLLLHGLARMSQSVPFDEPGGYFIMNLESTAGWHIRRYLTVSVGGRLDWQRYTAGPAISGQPNLTGDSVVALLAFVRMQVNSRVVQF